MIPKVEDLKSSPMPHRFGDCFNPPGLTNFLGCVQTDVDIVGIRSLNFPPFACSDTVTNSLFVNGKLFPAWGKAVTIQWFPDRIERTCEIDGLQFKSILILAWGKTAAIVQLHVKNAGASKRPVVLRFGLRGGVTKKVAPWTDAFPPTEADNEITLDPCAALIFSARNSTAVSMQGVHPPTSQISTVALKYEFDLTAGETKTFTYVNAIADTREEARTLYDSLIASGEREIARARDEWNRELAAVFTPGNDRYSGHLPELETSDADIAKIYHIGALGTIYFKRDTPHSVLGRVYGTLMPRYWQTAMFLWDYSLSSVVHALLDPAVMRKKLDLWMHLNIHKHFGTEFLTGQGIGPWYAVNDFAMTTIARDYLRFNGDKAWLDTQVGNGNGNGTVLDYLVKYAENHQQFTTKSGLADYGGLNNLLECVDSYLHEVASLNAANVFNLRTVAEIFEMRGRSDVAAKLRGEAKELSARVQQLYIDGKGYWNARFPDGSLHEVRHVYDLITVLNSIPEDLSEKQKREMVDFFKRELRTPTWMHALSCDDDDAMFSVRPDHQWTGAYPAWPPLTVTGLYRIGQGDLAFDWLKGLAKSANQGPYGQAHFVETVFDPEDGGARKASADFPYINDWTCSSNGAWCNIIIESIFGVRAGFTNITATPQFGRFDPESRLKNLRWQGKIFDVTRKGLSSD